MRRFFTLIGVALLLIGAAVAFYAVGFRPSPPNPGFEVAWTYEAPAAGAVISSPALDGQRVYVGVIRDFGFAPRGSVVCLDLASGTPIWSFDDDGEMIHMYSSPRLSAGRLYVGEGMHANFKCHLFALEADSGRKLWRFPASGHIESTPWIADGRVFFGAGDDGLYAVDAVTGKKSWHFQGLGHIDSSPAIFGERVFFGSGISRQFTTSTLFCLNARNGDTMWRMPVDLPAWGSPVVAGTRVFFGLGNGRVDRSDARPAGALVCVDAQTGRALWRHKTADAVFGKATVDASTVYFGSRDGVVAALELEHGEVRWTRPLGDPIVTTPAVLGERLYLTTISGRVHALDAATGEVLATYDLASQVRSPAKVLSSSAVVVEPTTGRHLIVFGAELQTGSGNVAAVYALRF